MPITHSKVSSVSDGADTTLVRPSDWNASHVTTGMIPEFVRKPSDTTIQSDTTTNDDPHMTFAIAANDLLYFQAWLIWNTATTTMNGKIGWSYPAGCTMLWGYIGHVTLPGAGYSGGPSGGLPTAMFTETTEPLFGSNTNTTFGQAYAGMITNSSTAGNITLKWAQNTSVASDMTLKTNSLLMRWKLN